MPSKVPSENRVKSARQGNPRLWRQSVLTRFASRGADLVVLNRPSKFLLEERVERASVAEFRCDVRRTTIARAIREGLTQVGMSDDIGLATDMISVARGFFRNFPSEVASLRVELVDRRHCPKFHQDNVHVRLLVTYAGPGTEYAPAHDESEIHQAPREAVVLMKGRKHPTNDGAILHRSPNLPPGHRRLCMVIDY